MANINFSKYKKAIELGFTDDEISEATGFDTSIYKGLYKQNFGEGQKQNIFQKSGIHISPEQVGTEVDPYGIGKTVEEGVLTPAAHFANQALLNAPRAYAEAQGMSYPEAETLPGQILSKGAGIAGAFTGPINLIGRGVNTAIKSKRFFPSVGKGALTGALTGSAYTPTESPLDPMKRLEQAGIGASLGTIGSSLGYGIGKAFRKLRPEQSKASTSLEASKIPSERMRRVETAPLSEFGGKSREEIRRELGSAIENERRELGRELPQLTEKVSSLKEGSKLGENIFSKALKRETGQLGEEASMLSERGRRAETVFSKRQKQLSERARLANEKEVGNLTNELIRSGEESSEMLAERLPKVRREGSRLYGEKLKEIIGDGEITADDFSAIIDNTKRRMVERNIPTDEIDNLYKSVSSLYESQNIPIGKVINLVDEVQPAASKFTKGQFKVGDISSLNLKHALTEHLENIGYEGIKDLRASYKPFIQAVNKIGNRAKTGDLYGRKAFAQDIVSYAKEKARPIKTRTTLDEEQALEAIQSGVGEYPKTGDVTSKVLKAAEDIETKKAELPRVSKEISDKYGRKTREYVGGTESKVESIKNRIKQVEMDYGKMSNEYATKIDDEIGNLESIIKDKKNLSGERIDSLSKSIAELENDVNGRIKSLREGKVGKLGSSKRAKLEKLIAQKTKMERLRKIAGSALLVATGAYAGQKVGGKILQGR